MKPLETRRRPFGVEKAHQRHQIPLNCTFLHCIRKLGRTKGCRSIFFNEINGLARILNLGKSVISLKIRYLHVTLQVTSQVTIKSKNLKTVNSKQQQRLAKHP
jgi:hypothetical protein